MRAKCLFGLFIFALALGILWSQEKPKSEEKPTTGGAAASASTAEPAHPAKITPEDVARKNPMKFNTVSVERGKKIYATQCAMCHGEKGDGKGDAAAEMKINPPDFTKPETFEKRTDGELFAIIGAGSDVMPGQGKRMTDNHKWNLVNYLRSLSGKTPERATGKEPEENIILIPQ